MNKKEFSQIKNGDILDTKSGLIRVKVENNCVYFWGLPLEHCVDKGYNRLTKTVLGPKDVIKIDKHMQGTWYD